MKGDRKPQNGSNLLENVDTTRTIMKPIEGTGLELLAIRNLRTGKPWLNDS